MCHTGEEIYFEVNGIWKIIILNKEKEHQNVSASNFQLNWSKTIS